MLRGSSAAGVKRSGPALPEYFRVVFSGSAYYLVKSVRISQLDRCALSFFGAEK